MENSLNQFVKSTFITLILSSLACSTESPDQDSLYQSAIKSLSDSDFMISVKEARKKAYINKYEEKLKDLDLTSREKVKKVFSLTSEEAKKEAYDLAAMMDRKNNEKKSPLNFSRMQNLQKLEDFYNNYEEEIKRNSVNYAVFGIIKPSYTITFQGETVQGIGHHLFVDIYNKQVYLKKTKYNAYLLSARPINTGGNISLDGDNLPRIDKNKEDFITSYNQMTQENKEKVELWVKSIGGKFSDLLF